VFDVYAYVNLNVEDLILKIIILLISIPGLNIFQKLESSQEKKYL